MATTFRKATPEDAQALSELAARTFSDTYAEFNTPDDMRQHLDSAFGVEKQAREIADTAMATLLADSDGELIGYTQLRRHAPADVALDDPVEIYRFYVDRRSHGKGVAQGLMAAALDAAAEMGGKTAWLGVWERNPRAIAFYMKSGFREVGTQIFQLGADRQTDRVMARPTTTSSGPRR